MTRTRTNNRHTLIWFGIAAALSVIVFVLSLMSQVSSEAWVPLLKVSPRQVSFVEKFDRLIQIGAVSYINEFNSTDMADPEAVTALNARHIYISTNAAEFKRDCPERTILLKQDEFYQEMLLYAEALKRGDIPEISKRMETSQAKVLELINLLKEYGYKV